MGDNHDRKLMRKMALANRNFWRIIVHVEYRVVVQKERKGRRLKREAKIKRSVLVANTPDNARMQS